MFNHLNWNPFKWLLWWFLKIFIWENWVGRRSVDETPKELFRLGVSFPDSEKLFWRIKVLFTLVTFFKIQNQIISTYGDAHAKLQKWTTNWTIQIQVSLTSFENPNSRNSSYQTGTIFISFLKFVPNYLDCMIFHLHMYFHLHLELKARTGIHGPPSIGPNRSEIFKILLVLFRSVLV